MAIFDTAQSSWRKENIQFWSNITQFYQNKGMDAWDRLVPHVITNNPEIAHAYAKLITHYMIDCRRKGYQGKFTIVEPGAGLGKFAFYFIKELQSLMHVADISPSTVRYVVTDTSDQSTQFWNSHPQLEPHFQSGILQTARLCVNDALEVEFSLDLSSCEDRLILIANYCFDSLYQSPFQLYDGRFVPCRITRKNRPITSSHEVIQYHPIPAASRPYSPQPYYDDILDEHLACGIERTLMPDGPIALIRWLDAINDHPLLVVSSDKGFPDFRFDHYAENFNIISTGTYASCVNFFALGRYVELALAGSKLFGPSDQVQFATQVFMTRDTLESYPGTMTEGHSLIASMGIYGQIKTNLLTNCIKVHDAQMLFNVFSAHRFSIHSLVELYDNLENVMQDSEALECIDIDRALRLFLANYYFTPHDQSITELACLGNLALMAKRFTFGKLLLELFVKHHGRNYQYHRLAGNYFFLQSEFSSAAHHFTEALSANPECTSSKTFLEHCETLM